MGGRRGTADAVLARLGGRSHGIVTREAAIAAGVSGRALEIRLARGSLIRVHDGVYRVGHAAPSLESRYLAAVLACGPRAALSGRAAAFLWEVIRGTAPEPEVTAPTNRRRAGIHTHRWRPRRPARGGGLPRYPQTTHRGIPIAMVPRVLVEIAGVLTTRELARACHEAGVRHGVTPAQVERQLRIVPNARGARRLRAVLAGGVDVTLSALERRFLALVRARRLPAPVANRVAGSHRVDCRWPSHGLTVELDSYGFHNSRHSWEADRDREREARSRGDQFRRYTYGDVFEHPEPMLVDLERLLA